MQMTVRANVMLGTMRKTQLAAYSTAVWRSYLRRYSARTGGAIEPLVPNASIHYRGTPHRTVTIAQSVVFDGQALHVAQPTTNTSVQVYVSRNPILPTLT